jgi:basic membrane protein A
MTSMLKKVDVATYDFITSAVNGAPLTGEHKYSLSNNGIGYATSGGMIDDIVPDLEKAKADIIAGTVVVPSTTG